jgi:thiamine-phosphate pyrophosphorylase
MRLIVITHYGFVPQELDKIHALFEAGMEILHVRKPNFLKTEYVNFLNGIDKKYHPQIKIHDFLDLADHYNLLGVHFNLRTSVYKGDRKVKISKSCHSIEELKEIDGYDYVFLSPIFNSISKVNCHSKFTNETLEKASIAGLINEKVIALGGIGEHTLPLLKQFPWGGAAVLGGIWKTGDAVANFLKLKQYDE